MHCHASIASSISRLVTDMMAVGSDYGRFPRIRYGTIFWSWMLFV